MKIIKNKDHVLLKNLDGEYHLSAEKFNELGEANAIKFAESEIDKKRTRHFTGDTIDFKKARALGFCEYGLEDFCKKLNLDIDASHNVKELRHLLTKEIIEEYSDECLKVFGASMLDKFGGAIGYVKETKNYGLILRTEFIKTKDLHLLACLFAEKILDNFERNFPDDDRPRLAIEAKRKWINGDISDDELNSAESAAAAAAAESAESAAWSAARSAAAAAAAAAWSAAAAAAWSAWSAAARSAWSAAARSAWSADAAAWSAARSAAWSAARSVARSAESAARSAAESAAIDYFTSEVIIVLQSYEVRNEI